MRHLLFFCLISLPGLAQTELAFTISEKDFVPEGIAFDPHTKSFFVGSVHKHKIIRIDSLGQMAEFVPSRADQLGEVVGMRVDSSRHELWVCSNDSAGAYVHRYSIATGKLLGRASISNRKQRHFFNDLIVIDGIAYVTDSDEGAVYRLGPGQQTPTLVTRAKQLMQANGICIHPLKDHIIVAGIGLYTIQLATGAIQPVSFPSYQLRGIDGLYSKGDQLIAIQNVTYPPTISRFTIKNHSIVRASVLLSDDPSFQIPTTGAWVGNWFYFIANSQLDNYANGQFLESSRMSPVRIHRLKIP